MEFITKKLDFSNQTITEMKLNSKNFYNLVKKRRSIRDFKNQKIDFEIIKNAVLAAGTAPNGANLQPWHFVIIKNKVIKKRIQLNLFLQILLRIILFILSIIIIFYGLYLESIN